MLHSLNLCCKENVFSKFKLFFILGAKEANVTSPYYWMDGSENVETVILHPEKVESEMDSNTGSCQIQ